MLILKNLSASARDSENKGLILNWEESLEEEMATHSSNLVWRIPWTREPGGLQSIGFQRDGHDGSDLACTHHRNK